MGPRLAGIAAMMGTPLIPWQRYVADVACELDEDTGTFHYDTIVISTPRQCGKSALVDSSDTFNASLGRRRLLPTRRRPARTPRTISRSTPN